MQAKEKEENRIFERSEICFRARFGMNYHQ